jgi:hypothetical protein
MSYHTETIDKHKNAEEIQSVLDVSQSFIAVGHDLSSNSNQPGKVNRVRMNARAWLF